MVVLDDNGLTYGIHRLTNAAAEGIKSKIMAIKRRAGAYWSPEHFKIAIYLLLLRQFGTIPTLTRMAPGAV